MKAVGLIVTSSAEKMADLIVEIKPHKELQGSKTVCVVAELGDDIIM